LLDPKPGEVFHVWLPNFLQKQGIGSKRPSPEQRAQDLMVAIDTGGLPLIDHEFQFHGKLSVVIGQLQSSHQSKSLCISLKFQKILFVLIV
jgi:hypothetical protein